MGRSKERVESESNGRTALEERDDRTKERVESAAMGCSSRTALKERDGLLAMGRTKERVELAAMGRSKEQRAESNSRTALKCATLKKSCASATNPPTSAARSRKQQIRLPIQAQNSSIRTEIPY